MSERFRKYEDGGWLDYNPFSAKEIVAKTKAQRGNLASSYPALAALLAYGRDEDSTIVQAFPAIYTGSWAALAVLNDLIVDHVQPVLEKNKVRAAEIDAEIERLMEEKASLA